MNTGIFGEGFPYSDFHNLNMDWIIKIAKDFLDQYTHIQEIIEQGETDIQDLTTSGLNQLQDKADNLEELLQAWYNEHSEDIANQLADAIADLNAWYTEHSQDIADELRDALADLNTWYTQHQGYLDQYLTDSIASFNSAADAKAEATLESIPADYTELSNNVDIIDENLKDNFNYGIGKIGQKRIEDCTNRIVASERIVTRFAFNPSYFAGGKLKSVTFKQSDSIDIRFFIAKLLDNGNIVKQGTFVISTTPGTNTYVNGVDFLYENDIPANALIGYQYIYYAGYFGGTEKSYTYGGAFDDVTYITDADYEVNAYGIGLSCEYESSYESIKQTINKYINGIKFGNEIPTNTYVLNEADIIHVQAIYSTGSDAELRLIRNADTSVKACRIEFVNFLTRKIGFYEKAYSPSDTLTVKNEVTSSMAFTIGHLYDILSIKINSNISIITINDAYTGNSFSTMFVNSENNLELGVGWGYRQYSAGTGITVNSMKNYSLQPAKSRICVIGDSYVEGNSLLEYPNSYNKRYYNKINELLKGDTFMWAQGGAGSYSAYTWMNTILSLNESEYYLIDIGMNDSSASYWQTHIEDIIETITNNNKIPILCTIPPTSNAQTNEQHMLMNQYIRNSGLKYVDIAKIMSLNNDGITYDATKFLSDNIHPTVKCHDIIFKAIKNGFPEIFGSAIE